MSDCGAAFMSLQFKVFVCQVILSILQFVYGRHPWANGQVERMNATLVPILQASKTIERNWDKNVLEVESQINNAHNNTIGDTLFRVLHACHPSFYDRVL